MDRAGLQYRNLLSGAYPQSRQGSPCPLGTLYPAPPYPGTGRNGQGHRFPGQPDRGRMVPDRGNAGADRGRNQQHRLHAALRLPAQPRSRKRRHQGGTPAAPAGQYRRDRF